MKPVRHIAHWIVALSLLAADLPTAAAADLLDLSLEDLLEVEVVTAASRHAQQLADAPASVTIVTGEDIANYGWRSLADLLRSMRGAYVSYDRNYSYLGFRGFGRPGDYNTRVLVLVDGHRINDGVYDGALLGNEFPLDLNVVERVEIVRGPASSVYGTNAFFGTINVITRRAAAVKPVALTFSAASFPVFSGTAAVGHEFAGGVEVFAHASALESSGQDHVFGEFAGEPGGGLVRDSDKERAGKLFASVGWRGFTLQAAQGSRSKLIPTASYETLFGDPRAETTDATSWIGLAWQREIFRNASLFARTAWSRYRYQGSYPYDPDPAAAPFYEEARADWWGIEAALTLRLNQRDRLVTGLEFRDNYRQDQITYPAGPPEMELDERRAGRIGAVYGQYELQARPWLRLVAGLRHDSYSTFGGTTNPRLAAILSPADGTTVKLLHGSAFRAPSAYELYYHAEGSQKASEDARPETIRTSEVVLEQSLSPALQGAVSLYDYRVRSLIDLEADPMDGLLVFRNRGRIHASGMEMELRGRWKGGVEGRASVSLQNAHAVESGERVSNSPSWLGRLNLSFPLRNNSVRVGCELQTSSTRITLAGNQSAAFATANLTVRLLRLAGGADAGLSIFNVFDARYADPGSVEHVQDTIEQDGRTLRLTLGLGR